MDENGYYAVSVWSELMSNEFIKPSEDWVVDTGEDHECFYC